MGHLIDDMLKLSRLTRAEMNREKVDLSALAQGIVERLKRDESQRQVEVSIQAGLIADCDPNLLEAVLVNLLENAFKFTSKRADAVIEFGQTELEGGVCSLFVTTAQALTWLMPKNFLAPFIACTRLLNLPELASGWPLSSVLFIVMVGACGPRRNLGGAPYFILHLTENEYGCFVCHILRRLDEPKNNFVG